MSEFKQYRKSQLAEMRPYVPGEEMSGVSVSDQDAPEEGGMIARNADNHADLWYVARAFFEKNYTPRDGEPQGVPVPRSDGLVLAAPFIHVQLQDGPIKENGVNGCQVDDVISWCIGVVGQLNGNFPCRENSLAITKLQEADHWLFARRRDREARGVEGTNEA